MIKRILRWYRVNFVPYVILCAATEHVFLSKALWHKIVKELPLGKRNDIRIFFEKYPIEEYVGKGASPYLYRFFVNADLSSIHTPEGGEPFTTQVQFGRYGHIGFQSVQPTPIEILTEYRIASQDYIENCFADYVSLKVQQSRMPNGDIYYNVLPIEVDDRYRPNETDPDPKELLGL